MQIHYMLKKKIILSILKNSQALTPLFWLIIPFLGEHFYAIIITFKLMFWKTGAFVSSVRLHLTIGKILDFIYFGQVEIFI